MEAAAETRSGVPGMTRDSENFTEKPLNPDKSNRLMPVGFSG